MGGGEGFGAGVAFGAVVGAALAVTVYTLWDRKRGAPTEVASAPKKRVVSDEIYREQFARNIKFFGEEGQLKVENSFVVVVGVGGVGSHAAHLLLRSGVGKIRVIDFDQVSVSSLNRHAVATQEDVGISKVAVLKKHFAEICPKAEVDAVADMFDYERADELLGGTPSFVLDCIDNLDTKVDLLKYCSDHSIPVISSMGAGAKADVSTIRYGTIDEAEGDELAVAVRKGLRKKGVNGRNITACFATEKARMKLLPLEEHQEEDPSLYKAIPNLRLRIIPVLGTMPSAFGLALASYVLCHIAGQPIKLTPYESAVNRNNSNKLMQRLEAKEKREHGVGRLDTFTLDDLDYVLNNVFRGRSVLSGKKLHPTLVRWDINKAATLDNIVLLSEGEAAQHKNSGTLEGLDTEYVQKVDQLLAEVRDYLEGQGRPTVATYNKQ
eukprot:comp16759_c0_seq1/m.15104 comp16759_c0_seq1/g.15104  ORF comp16759_c0_seq1/g.15104 comp16759_c0_seq1/m.15104 type:complete len:437 (-) comp16759_c0_seq1:289-1599(-)